MARHQPISPEQKEALKQATIAGDVLFIADFLKYYGDHPEILERYGEAGLNTENDPVENARRMIAYMHNFNDWQAYEGFKNQLRDENSTLWQFERAIDAIVKGETAILKNLLQQNPDLINMRSVRKHESTLLLYAGANGIEYYRQKTPPNAVEITGILLTAGAEVDAIGLMYGGSTTLGLVATSVHPVITGIQEPLMDILIKHGADPNIAVAADYTDGMLIKACLANGRGEPVEYLSKHGARLDLEAACGVGDLTKVKSYFTANGTLVENSLEAQRNAGLIWACEYDRIDVVEYLLAHGTPIDLLSGGMTPLHGAVLGGSLRIVNLLLSHKAPLEIKNSYDGTVLGQALWCGYNNPKPQALAIIETLIAHSAHIQKDWQGYISELREILR
ncbi:MAG: Ankyrin repeat-containing protein [Mucilaginibacter sp.]|nr:Ankyrin repeat-containing protein [Mucilaginibacter sp.]